MSYELFIGLRYLRAKRKQTFISVISLISVVGITVGVTALIIVLSVMTGFEDTMKEKILGINAHIVVTGFGGGITGYDKLRDAILKVDGVAGASPFTYAQAMISGGAGATGAVIRGLDTRTAGSVTVLPARIKSGSLEGINAPLGKGGEDGELAGIVLGSELARNIGARLGEQVNVISPSGAMTPAGPVPRMAAFRVTGIFELGMYEYDSNMAFVSVGNAQRFFRLGDTVNGVEVKIKDIYGADAVARGIRSSLGSRYFTRTWMEMNRNLFAALRLEKVAMFIILSLIILVAALNIISTLIMVVMEKNKDIAILKSLGATNASIMKIFMIEGTVIGFAGTFFGALVGIISALNLEWISGLIERLLGTKILQPSVYYIDKLPSKVEPFTIAVIIVTSLLISFLATLYPSWQASRLDPVESLRYE